MERIINDKTNEKYLKSGILNLYLTMKNPLITFKGFHIPK